MSLFRQYLAQRLLASAVTLLGVSVIVFLMVRVLPGDPAQVLAGLLASEEEVARLRTDLGLDRPLHVQYAVFLERLLHGDLGRSARTSQPVLEELKPRLRATLTLAVVSAALATVPG